MSDRSLLGPGTPVGTCHTAGTDTDVIAAPIVQKRQFTCCAIHAWPARPHTPIRRETKDSPILAHFVIFAFVIKRKRNELFLFLKKKKMQK
ncbi:MAG: hypothetical protein ACLTSX_06290 [Collinsella sp.]